MTGPEDAVLIIDGIFLLRPELRGLWNWSVWLEVPIDVAFAADGAARRLRPGPRRARRTIGTATARSCYRREAAPTRAASVIVDNTDPAHPRRMYAGFLLMPAGDGSGILLVDKPGGMTSHDVVSRARQVRSAPARSATPARSTRWRRDCSSSGSTPRPGCSPTSSALDKTYEATIRLGVVDRLGRRRRRGDRPADPAASLRSTPRRIDAGIAAPHRARSPRCRARCRPSR